MVKKIEMKEKLLEKFYSELGKACRAASCADKFSRRKRQDSIAKASCPARLEFLWGGFLICTRYALTALSIR